MVVNVIDKKTGFVTTYYSIIKVEKLCENSLVLFFYDAPSIFVELSQKSLVIENSPLDSFDYYDPSDELPF